MRRVKSIHDTRLFDTKAVIADLSLKKKKKKNTWETEKHGVTEQNSGVSQPLVHQQYGEP